MLSCLVWKIRSPPFSCIWSYMRRKVIGLGNIEGPYPRAWNFQGRMFWTIYAPCKNIVMLPCLVWKIRSPHFNVYGLQWCEKSSGSDTSNLPTQGPELCRVGIRGQSTPPVKIYWCYLVQFGRSGPPTFMSTSGSEKLEAPTQGPERGRTSKGEIGPVADQFYEILNLTIFVIWLIRGK